MVNSNTKGGVGERELSRYLSEIFGVPTRRSVQYSGKDPDAACDIVGLDGIHVECKRVEKLRLWESLTQAKRDTHHSRVPVVFHRANNRPWIVIVELDQLIVLAYRVIENINKGERSK